MALANTEARESLAFHQFRSSEAIWHYGQALLLALQVATRPEKHRLTRRRAVIEMGCSFSPHLHTLMSKYKKMLGSLFWLKRSCRSTCRN